MTQEQGAACSLAAVPDKPRLCRPVRREGELQAGGTCQPGVGTRAASGTSGCAPGRLPRTQSPAHALDVNEAFAVPTCQLERFTGAELGLERGGQMGALHLHPVPAGIRLHHLNLRSSPSSFLRVPLSPLVLWIPPTFPFPLPLRLCGAPLTHGSSASLWGKVGTHGPCACPFCVSLQTPSPGSLTTSAHRHPVAPPRPEQRSLSRPRSHGPRTCLCLHFHPQMRSQQTLRQAALHRAQLGDGPGLVPGPAVHHGPGQVPGHPWSLSIHWQTEATAVSL